ncbi:unnamed protein product, partial [Amoebophrya sp. A25]
NNSSSIYDAASSTSRWPSLLLWVELLFFDVLYTIELTAFLLGLSYIVINYVRNASPLKKVVQDPRKQLLDRLLFVSRVLLYWIESSENLGKLYNMSVPKVINLAGFKIRCPKRPRWVTRLRRRVCWCSCCQRRGTAADPYHISKAENLTILTA